MKIIILALLFYVREMPYKLKQNIRHWKSLKWFLKDARIITNLLRDNKDWGKIQVYPCLLDKTDEGGSTKTHYFHQDLWVAQQIFKDNPINHVDVGSRVDGFVAHIASFRRIEVLDVRPINNQIENISFGQADLMKEGASKTNYCDSLSCLHAIEHFGLGRYGDPIDINGHVKGIENLHKMLKKAGILYLSMPIGSQRIEFNAHRVFDLTYLLCLFEDKFNILDFSYIDDKGVFFKNVALGKSEIKTNFECHFGCGIFKLQKK